MISKTKRRSAVVISLVAGSLTGEALMPGEAAYDYDSIGVYRGEGVEESFIHRAPSSKGSKQATDLQLFPRRTRASRSSLVRTLRLWRYVASRTGNRYGPPAPERSSV